MEESVKEVKNEEKSEKVVLRTPPGLLPHVYGKRAAYSYEQLEQFLTEYQRNGRNATKAAILIFPELKDNYYMAAKRGERMLKRVDLQSADMILALRSVGVGAQKIAEKIMQLLDSKKILKTFTKDGDVRILEEDNYNAIDKGLVHALKIGIGGGYKAEEIRQSGMVGHAHFSLGDLFEKAKQRELQMQSEMSPEDYKDRVNNLIANAKDQYATGGERGDTNEAGI